MKTPNLILLLPLAIALGGCKPKGRSVAEFEGVHMVNSQTGIRLDPGVISIRPKLGVEEVEREALNSLLGALSDGFHELIKENAQQKERVRCLEVNQETLIDLLSNFADTNAVLQKRITTLEATLALLNHLERAEVKP